MKKITIWTLASVMLVTMVFSFTGCTSKAVEESKQLLEEYYELFSDHDAEDMIDLFDEDVIDDFGGEEAFVILLLSRIDLLGDDVEYNIVGTSYEKNNKKVEVLLDVEATYDRDDTTYEEQFLLENIDDEMIITEVYLEREEVLDDMPEDFFDAYNNEDEEDMLGLMSDAFFDIFTEDELYNMLTQAQNALGEYQSHDVNEEYFYHTEYEDKEVVLLYECFYDVTFENGTAEGEIELCLEDDEVKIVFFSIDPTIVLDYIDEYYTKMVNEEFTDLLNMYADFFYENTEGGAQGWAEILDVILTYGDYVDHQVYDWTYEELEMDDGTFIDVYTVFLDAQFGDTTFLNEIQFVDDKIMDEQHITSHTIEIGE
ncbi:MAG: hypothetical protein KAQ68_00205 [Clostridiales bacterium]|nr:hypothetical protein [Clostridiales bacterium]